MLTALDGMGLAVLLEDVDGAAAWVTGDAKEITLRSMSCDGVGGTLGGRGTSAGSPWLEIVSSFMATSSTSMPGASGSASALLLSSPFSWLSLMGRIG